MGRTDDEKALAYLAARVERKGITRRELIRRGSQLGLSMLALGPLLAACGDGSGSATTSGSGTSNTTAASNTSAAANTTTGGSTLTKLGFSHPFPGSGIYIPIENGMLAEAEKQGVEVLQSQADGQADKQLAELNTWIETGVQAISILNINGEGLKPVVDRAHEAGAKIIGYANHIDGEDGYNTFDNFQGAELVAEEAERWIKENLPDEDRIEVGLLTLDTLEVGKIRVHHAFDTLKEKVPQVEVVASAEGTNLAAPAQEATRAMIQQNPNIRMMICISDDGQLGAYQALKAVGKEKDVWLAGYDGLKAAIELLAAGDMIGCTASIPLWEVGEANVWVASNLLSGDGPTSFDAPYKLVTNNTPELAEELLADYEEQT